MCFELLHIVSLAIKSNRYTFFLRWWSPLALWFNGTVYFQRFWSLNSLSSSYEIIFMLNTALPSALSIPQENVAIACWTYLMKVLYLKCTVLLAYNLQNCSISMLSVLILLVNVRCMVIIIKCSVSPPVPISCFFLFGKLCSLCDLLFVGDSQSLWKSGCKYSCWYSWWHGSYAWR